MIGIHPCELWDMELWELNACVKAYNKQQAAKGKDTIASCWQTAAFTGAAYAGKLRKLDHYFQDDTKSEAPKITKEEFDRKLKLFEEGRNDHGT